MNKQVKEINEIMNKIKLLVKDKFCWTRVTVSTNWQLLLPFINKLMLFFHSVILCSYWFLDMPNEPIDDVKVYHPTSGFSTLPDFLSGFKENGEQPVYIGFGSMEELGFFSSIDCVELLCILNEGKTRFYLFSVLPVFLLLNWSNSTEHLAIFCLFFHT